MYLGLTYTVSYVQISLTSLKQILSNVYSEISQSFFPFLHTYILQTNRILLFLCTGQLLSNQIFPWHIFQTPLPPSFNWHATAAGNHRSTSFQGHINTLVDQCGNGKAHLRDSLEVYGDSTIG